MIAGKRMEGLRPEFSPEQALVLRFTERNAGPMSSTLDGAMAATHGESLSSPSQSSRERGHDICPMLDPEMTVPVQRAGRLPISNGGFTLIELIMVIVILGVLAATALPKFMSLSADARIAVVTRVRVEVAGAANLAYTKCLMVSGCVATNKGTALNGPDGRSGFMYNGYPTGKSRTGTNGYFGIKEWVNVGGLTVVEVSTSVTEFREPTASDPANCLVRYTEAPSLGASPTTIIVTTGC